MAFPESDQRHDHLRYSASQRAYKYGRDIEGIADPHQWAGDHQHDFLPPLEALVTEDDSPDTAGADEAMTTGCRRRDGLEETESRCYLVAFGHDAELAAASRRDHGPLGPFTGRWRLLTATEAAELADTINTNSDQTDGEARVVQVVHHRNDPVTPTSSGTGAPATADASQVVEGHSTSTVGA